MDEKKGEEGKQDRQLKKKRLCAASDVRRPYGISLWRAIQRYFALSLSAQKAPRGPFCSASESIEEEDEADTSIGSDIYEEREMRGRRRAIRCFDIPDSP